MNYKVGKNNIHIEDSFSVRGRDFGKVLGEIAEKEGENTSVFDLRPLFSLKMEWAVHNFLYRIGFMRSHTKDVDLNAPNPYECAYCIFGIIVWIFVR